VCAWLMLDAWRKNRQCALRRTVGVSGHFVEEKNLLTLMETEPRIVQPLA
jgi:hypothetical protein